MEIKKPPENNVYKEAYDDCNFDVQPKRQVKRVNLSLFRNDRSSIFSNRVFGIDITVIYTGA